MATKMTVSRRRGRTAFNALQPYIKSGSKSDMKLASTGRMTKTISRRGKSAVVRKKGLKVVGGKK